MEPRVGRASGAMALLLAGSVASCQSAVVRVDLGALEGALFVVEVGASGQPRSIEGPLVVAEAARRGGARPQRVLADEEVRVFVVAVSPEELTRLVPGFAVELTEALRLQPAPAPEDADSAVLWRTLPPSAGTWEVDLDSGALASSPLPETVSLLLGVPRDAEHCRPTGWSELEPYARELVPVAFPAGAPRLGATPALPLDERRVLLGFGDVALLERGRSFVPQTSAPRNLLASRDLAPPEAAGAALVTLTLDPGATAGGRARAWALVQGSLPEGARTWLRAIDVDATGLTLGPIIDLGPELLDDLDVLATGDVVVTGRRGPVRLVQPQAERVEVLPDLPVGGVETAPRRVRFTGMQDTPLVASTLSTLHVFSPAAGLWLSTDIRELGEPGKWILGLAADGARRELWAAGSLGVLFRKVGRDPWAPVHLDLPPRWAPCAPTDGRGGPGGRPEFNHVALLGDHAWVAPRGCLALMVIRRADDCVTLFSDGAGVRATTGSVVHVSATERQVVLVGQDGAIYVSEWRR